MRNNVFSWGQLFFIFLTAQHNIKCSCQLLQLDNQSFNVFFFILTFLGKIIEKKPFRTDQEMSIEKIWIMTWFWKYLPLLNIDLKTVSNYMLVGWRLCWPFFVVTCLGVTGGFHLHISFQLPFELPVEITVQFLL